MRRVLLVDDEVHVLSALQRIMRPFLQEYEIEVEARRLEVEEPGITQVRRDADGAVYLD